MNEDVKIEFIDEENQDNDVKVNKDDIKEDMFYENDVEHEDDLEGFEDDYDTKRYQQILEKFKSYISTERFEMLCADIEKKTGFDKRKVAKNFFQRILGTTSDFCCIGADTFENIIHITCNVVNDILKSAFTIIMKTAKAIIRVFTGNYTANITV